MLFSFWRHRDCGETKWEWIVNKISYIQLLYLWLVDNTVIGRQNIPHNRSIFFWFEFRPHSIIPVTWNQYNIYSHTSSTYRSVEGHRWLINWVTKTHPPSTPVACHLHAWRTNRKRNVFDHSALLTSPFPSFVLNSSVRVVLLVKAFHPLSRLLFCSPAQLCCSCRFWHLYFRYYWR